MAVGIRPERGEGDLDLGMELRRRARSESGG